MQLPFRGSVAVAGGRVGRGELAGSRWRRLLPDVYLAASVVPDRLTRCQAAALVLPPGAALSHESAAFLWGVDLWGRFSTSGPVTATQLTVPPPGRVRAHPGLVVHRAVIPPGDLVRRGGLPVTSRGRTAFDLGRGPDLCEAVTALDALLYRRLIRPADLTALPVRYKGWPGTNRFRAAAGLARPGAESPMESLVRFAIVTAGLPEPKIQHEVFDAAGQFVARLDLAYEEERLGLEYDGDHHRERGTFRRDAVRINRLQTLGWRVLRFTVADLYPTGTPLLDQVRRALKIHGTPRSN